MHHLAIIAFFVVVKVSALDRPRRVVLGILSLVSIAVDVLAVIYLRGGEVHCLGIRQKESTPDSTDYSKVSERENMLGEVPL